MKTAKELALMAARALSDKKGREIQVLEIGDLKRYLRANGVEMRV